MTAFQKVPEHFSLAAICDIDPLRTQATADELRVPKVYTSLDDLCADPAIDVIDLATPPHLHLAQIQQVLAAGKHVICEKPLVASLKDVDASGRGRARQRAGASCRSSSIATDTGLQKLKFLHDRGLAGKHYTTNIENLVEDGATTITPSPGAANGRPNSAVAA
jgi:hypothetical protein